MARCSPLGVVAVANTAEVKNLDVADDLVEVARAIADELPGASDVEGPALSSGGVDTFAGASDDENSRTYYFGSSTITQGRIKEMVEKGYFVEGEARESNAMAQLSKYFWAVGSIRGVPASNAFVKRYELHYQPKKVETLEGEMVAQYGYLIFHAKRDGGSKLNLAIKNKWSAGWTRS
jgi:hypothetical protein